MNIAKRLRNEGFQQGFQQALLRLLQRKFHSVPITYQDKLAQAEIKTLLTWGERTLDATSIDDVLRNNLDGTRDHQVLSACEILNVDRQKLPKL